MLWTACGDDAASNAADASQHDAADMDDAAMDALDSSVSSDAARPNDGALPGFDAAEDASIGDASTDAALACAEEGPAYRDDDGDGYSAGGAIEVCLEGELPAGFTTAPSSIEDCDDDNADVGYCGTNPLLWAKRAGGGGGSGAASIGMLADGSSIVTGSFSGSRVFGVGQPNETGFNSAGGSELFVARFDPSGALQWVKRSVSGTLDDPFSSDEAGRALALLTDGSSIVSGSFDGEMTLGAGEAGETTLLGTGNVDGFVARFAPNGDLAWAEHIASEGQVHTMAAGAASDGSVVIAGDFIGATTFGAGEANETTLDTGNEYDHFIARFAADGTLVWAKQIVGLDNLSGWDDARSLAVMADGSFYFAGIVLSATTFAVGEPEETTLPAPATGSTIFIARYAADGSLDWIESSAVDDTANYIEVAALNNGTALLTGRFAGTAVFGAGEAHETALADIMDWPQSIFLARYAASGALSSAKIVARTSGGDDSIGALVGLSDGSALIAGSTAYRARFGPGDPNEQDFLEGDLFVARFGADDELAWLERPHSPGNNAGYGLAARSDGAFVLAGRFQGEMTFGFGEANETVLVNHSPAFEGSELYVARYAAGGALEWAQSVGGSGSGDDAGNAIAALADGAALVGGFFSGSAGFGVGEANEVLLSSAGEEDAFIARYEADGSLDWIEQVGGTSWDHVDYIVARQDGGAIAAFYCNGTCTLSPGRPYETTREASFVLARYGANGELLWAKAVRGMIGVFGLALLSDESILVSGQFETSATFGEGEPNEITLSTAEMYDRDPFAARFSADGTLRWARTVEGDKWIAARIDPSAAALPSYVMRLEDDAAIVQPDVAFESLGALADFARRELRSAVVLRDGSLIMGGVVQRQDRPFDNDAIVVRLTPSGALDWLERIRGNFGPAGPLVAAFADGSLALTGHFQGSVTFGEGETNETTLAEGLRYGFYMARLNPNGSLAWVKQGPDASEDRCRALATTADGSILATGGFAVARRFDDSERWLESAGSHDVFIVKYGP